jgi:hypothetical protein
MSTSSQIADAVLMKLAAEYDAYGNLVPDSPPIVPVAIGGTLGGAAAHLIPTEKARELREMAEKVPNTNKKMVIKLQDGARRINSEPMTAEAAKKLFRNTALRANSLRMLGGIGAGAASGYLLSNLLGD